MPYHKVPATTTLPSGTSDGSFGHWERSILGAAVAVLVARPLVSDFIRRPPAAERAEQRDVVTEITGRYNPMPSWP